MRQIQYSKDAFKFLKKLSKQDSARIISAIERKLPDEDDGPLIGHPPFRKLRVGNFRVIYVNNDVIEIVNIGNRGEIYRRIP